MTGKCANHLQEHLQIACRTAVSQELSLPYSELQQFRPSTVAAACFSMALWLLSAGGRPSRSSDTATCGGCCGGSADGTKDTGAPPTVAAAVTSGRSGDEAIEMTAATVAALAAAVDMGEQVLAPGIRVCFETLKDMYCNTMLWYSRLKYNGFDDRLPSWFPVLNRYKAVVAALEPQ